MFEEMGGEAVTQGVLRHRLGQTDLFAARSNIDYNGDASGNVVDSSGITGLQIRGPQSQTLGTFLPKLYGPGPVTLGWLPCTISLSTSFIRFTNKEI